MSEINISKYFIIHKDKNNNIFAIEQINPKGLFEAITKQNEQLHRYKQAIEEIKEIAESCSWNNGESLLFRRIEQIKEKCKEVNKQKDKQ